VAGETVVGEDGSDVKVIADLSWDFLFPDYTSGGLVAGVNRRKEETGNCNRQKIEPLIHKMIYR
jgi:hypothetical protein